MVVNISCFRQIKLWYHLPYPCLVYTVYMEIKASIREWLKKSIYLYMYHLFLNDKVILDIIYLSYGNNSLHWENYRL